MLLRTVGGVTEHRGIRAFFGYTHLIFILSFVGYDFEFIEKDTSVPLPQRKPYLSPIP